MTINVLRRRLGGADAVCSVALALCVEDTLEGYPQID
jgi:hypothetical protein